MADDFLETIELARKEGKDSSTLWLRLHKDGAISIEGQDFGPIMECFFAGRSHRDRRGCI